MSVVISCQNQPNGRQLVALQILRFFLSGNDLEITVAAVEETSGNVECLQIFGTTSVALPQHFGFFFNEIVSILFGDSLNLTDLSPLYGMRKLQHIHLWRCTAFRELPPDICRTTALNWLSFEEELTHFDYFLNLPILQNVEALDFGTGADLEMAWPAIRGLPNLKRLHIESSLQSLPSLLEIGDLASLEEVSLRCERITDIPWLDAVLRKQKPSLKCLDLCGCYNLSIPKEAILQCSDTLIDFECLEYPDDEEDYYELFTENAIRTHEMLWYMVHLNKSGRPLLRQPEVPLALWAQVFARCSDYADSLFFFLTKQPYLVPAAKREARQGKKLTTAAKAYRTCRDEKTVTLDSEGSDSEDYASDRQCATAHGTIVENILSFANISRTSTTMSLEVNEQMRTLVESHGIDQVRAALQRQEQNIAEEQTIGLLPETTDNVLPTFGATVRAHTGQHVTRKRKRMLGK